MEGTETWAVFEFDVINVKPFKGFERRNNMMKAKFLQVLSDSMGFGEKKGKTLGSRLG